MFAYDGSSLFHRCLETEVVKVNPKTSRIATDERKNTATRVWLECGPWERPENLTEEERKHLPHGVATIDLQLACGAPTFEWAIVKLANLVWRRYRTSRQPQRRIWKGVTRIEKAIRQAHREYLAGKSRPAEELLAEPREQSRAIP